MGLDMEVVRVTKSRRDDSIIYDRSELDAIVLEKDDLDNPMFSGLVPYTQPLQVRSSYYDIDSIRKDYNLSDHVYISAITHYSLSVTDRVTKKTVEVPQRDVESKYIQTRVDTCYVCDSEEIRYWRKAYNIQDWFHEHIDGDVENTGFYILSGELLLKFNKAFRDDALPAIEPDEESALFYWEWY